MTIPSNIIITKHLNRALTAWLTVAVFVFAVAPAFAHGGFDHVMGTVVKVADNVLTVKTAKGNVDVKLDDKTEITQSGQPAQLSDLAPGALSVWVCPDAGKHSV